MTNSNQVHVVMQAWSVKGGQSKYTGHCCSFMKDIKKVVEKVPTLPKDLDIIVVRPKETDDLLLASNSSFHVKRERLIDNLQVLRRFHPWFQVQGRIDWDALDLLPENGSVFDQLQSITQTSEESGQPHADSATTEESSENDIPVNQTSDTFVPSSHSTQMELAAIQTGLQLTEAVLTLPTIDGMPINEHDENRCYMVEAFPCLYPTGKADLHEPRDVKVNPEDYFKHLMRYHDGRFARHPRFRYFAWNSILRWLGKAKSRIFAKRNPQEGAMSVGTHAFCFIISLSL